MTINFNLKHCPIKRITMNSEVKAKWLEALRSGEYKQTAYTLRGYNDGFCCLGVLCDIYAKEFGGSWEWGYSEEYTYSFIPIVDEEEQDFVTTDLPDCVVEWAGLEESSPQVADPFREGEVAFCTLASLNDNGRDFEFIADLIDRDL